MRVAVYLMCGRPFVIVCALAVRPPVRSPSHPDPFSSLRDIGRLNDIWAFVCCRAMLTASSYAPEPSPCWLVDRLRLLLAVRFQTSGARKGVVWGKSVSVRVDLGGRRF